MVTKLVSQEFPKSSRVRKQADFDAVYRDSVHAADDVLVVQAVSNGQKKTRLGLSIGRKVGNAVVRNRWKRAIREVFRKSVQQFPVGIDIVIRPRKGAELSYAAIERSMPRLVARIAKKLGMKTKAQQE